MGDTIAYIADNYKITELEKKSVNLLQELRSTTPDGRPKFFDKRHLVLTTVDSTNWEFYLNYLDLCAAFSRQFPNSKPSYLLDLGYIPLIMLPTTHTDLGPQLTALLDAQHVPYVRQQPFSFLYGYTENIDTVDIWVPKIDIADMFGIKPEQVRSKDTFRRLIIDV